MLPRHSSENDWYKLQKYNYYCSNCGIRIKLREKKKWLILALPFLVLFVISVSGVRVPVPYFLGSAVLFGVGLIVYGVKSAYVRAD